MSSPAGRMAARALFVLCAALAVVGVALGWTLDAAGTAADGFAFALGQSVLAIGYPAVGTLVAARHPRNACGWILIAVGLFQGTSNAGYTYALHAEAGAALPAATAAMWVSNWIWFPSLALIVTFLLLLFPDGRLPSVRWRAPAVIIGVFVAVGTAFTMWMAWQWVSHGPDTDSGGWGEQVLFLGLLVAGAVSVASLFARFRRSREAQRRQLKWLALGGAAAFAGVLTAFLPELLMGPAFVLLLALPVSIGVAILRHRLYDIDRLISRTLSYVLLTVLLAGVYAGGVVLLRPVLGRLAGESDLAVAVSTLAVAALFGPARRRIQSVVDRRFNRAQYDAARVAEAFSARLREQLDLSQLSGELVGVVAQTVQPAGVSLWLREDQSSSSSSGS